MTSKRPDDDALSIPPAGDDPDTQTRMAKHLAAAGLDLPDGMSVDPVTDDEREAVQERHAKAAQARQAAADKATADQDKADERAQARSDKADDKAAADKAKAEAAAKGKTTPPQGRTTGPQSTA